MTTFDSTSRYADVAGGRLHYNEAGSGPALLTFHGGGPGANGWDNCKWNLDYLSKSFRVVLVDLPGYGYAKVSQKLRGEWGKEITEWFKLDPMIQLVFVLVDGRHGMQAQDLELVEFLTEREIPFVVVYTKMDKYKSNNQRKKAEMDFFKDAKKLGIAEKGIVFSTAVEAKGVSGLKKLIFGEE